MENDTIIYRYLRSTESLSHNLTNSRDITNVEVEPPCSDTIYSKYKNVQWKYPI